MSSKKVFRLRQSILKYNTELLKLKTQLLASEDANVKYNKILIKKAICKKELEDSSTPIVQKLLKKFSNNNRDKKLICDYFKS